MNHYFYIGVTFSVGLLIIYLGCIRRKRYAVINVDVQDDFCPGGALAVPHGDEVVPVINKITSFITGKSHSNGIVGYLRALWRSFMWDIYFSGDEHPEKTSHFDKHPVHCVKDTPGARLHKDLIIPRNARFVAKGILPDKDDYSALSPDGRVEETNDNLLTTLHKRGTRVLVATGLAGNICVLFTVIDALKLGFKVYVVTDAIRSINFQPGDHEKALTEMKAAGAILVTSDELIEIMK